MARSKDEKKTAAKKGSKKAEEPVESTSEESEVASDEEDDDDDEEEEEEAREGKMDGMADMMAKILNQKTARDVPVLEKRKTAIMKSIDEEREESAKLKKAQQDKAMVRNKQITLPGHSSIEKEKVLRKLATKGVVALFNAVAEAQRMQKDLEDVTEAGDKVAKVEKAEQLAQVDIKKMSKDNFLDLLTGGTTVAATASKAKTPASDDSDDYSDESDDNAPGNGKGGDSTWGALKDDYFHEDEEGAGSKLKNWDKSIQEDVEVDSEDSDAEEMLENRQIRSSVREEETKKTTKKRSTSSSGGVGESKTKLKAAKKSRKA